MEVARRETDDEINYLGLEFENTYAWVMRFDDQGLVAQVRAYLDSTLVADAVHGNVDSAEKNQRAPVHEP